MTLDFLELCGRLGPSGLVVADCRVDVALFSCLDLN
jgi:hypothetical protein